MVLNLLDINENKSQVISDFKRIVDQSNDEFNSMVEMLAILKQTDLDFLVSNPISRNIHNSNLYIDFCKVLLVKELISRKCNLVEIIVESASLKKVLSQAIDFPDFKIIVPKKYFFNFFNRIVFDVAYTLKVLAHKIISLIIFKLFFNHRVESLKHKGLVLIDTFAFPGYYSKDRYYSGLSESLDSIEKRHVLFVPTIVNTDLKDMWKAYKELLNSDRRFLFKESYINIIDIFFAVFYLIRIRFKKIKHLVRDGIDYSSLVNHDMHYKIGYSLSIEGLINYRFMKKLHLKHVRFEKFINWWEGHASDKGLNKGLKEFYPNIPVMGYLGYVPRTLELQLYPTKYEHKLGIIPDQISVIGDGFVNEIKKNNLQQEVVSAPAFRFSHLWDEVLSNTEQHSYVVLIALTISVNESFEIIKKVAASFSGVNTDTINFIVKPHPANAHFNLANNLSGIWPSYFNLSELDSKTLLRESDIVISGMSSICLESLALGIPVLVISGSNTIQYNPIPENIEQELWMECKNPQEIMDGFMHYSSAESSNLNRYKKIGIEIRKKYFNPVVQSKILNFINY